ncbi:hypothetical protein D046_0713A, partial [Vibrio parahaemolyticus V-223/04]
MASARNSVCRTLDKLPYLPISFSFQTPC